MLDHVSAAWTNYMAFSSYDVDGIRQSAPRYYPYHPYDVSILDSLFAFGLRRSNTYTGLGGGVGSPAAD